MKPRIDFFDLGVVDVDESLDYQLKFAKEVRKTNTIKVLMLTHSPSITLGKHQDLNALFVQSDVLEKMGLRIYRLNRGGQATYHGPGQLVSYILLDLWKLCLNVKQYVCILESIMLTTISKLGLSGERVDGMPGIFICGKKVGFIGIGIIHGVTIHGLCMNVYVDKSVYGYFLPCGIPGLQVVSIKELNNEICMERVIEAFKISLKEAFECY